MSRCSTEHGEDNAIIAEYNATWGQESQKYSCLADPDNDNYVIRELEKTPKSYFHYMFWPGLFTVVGLSIVLSTFIMEGCSLKHQGYFFRNRKCCRELPEKKPYYETYLYDD